MAKLSAHGSVRAMYETPSKSFRYLVMADGVVLERWNYEGKWQSPVIKTRRFKSNVTGAVAKLDSDVTKGLLVRVNATTGARL